VNGAQVDIDRERIARRKRYPARLGFIGTGGVIQDQVAHDRREALATQEPRPIERVEAGVAVRVADVMEHGRRDEV
jgi:hypothetical protein